jgi:hypothetical protein
VSSPPPDRVNLDRARLRVPPEFAQVAAMVLVSAPAGAAFDAAAICWDEPDTALAPVFDGVSMVQSFTVRLPGGADGRCWLPTSTALRLGGVGRSWVAGHLTARQALGGEEALTAELTAPGGLRLA